MESVNDIIAEMRKRSREVKAGVYTEPDAVVNMLDIWADRLEAAWKRERDRLMSEPRSWEECVERAMKVKENSDVLY